MPLIPMMPAEGSPDSRRPRLLPLRALLDDFDADAQALWDAAQSQTARGAVTGIAPLDDALGGTLAPGVHIVLGAPGVGKTAFALQIACTCGTPALYVSCEMSPLELLKRITARATGLFLGRLKSGELPPAHAAERVREAIMKTPYLALLDATGAYPDRPALESGANATRTLLPGCPHLLIVLDSLHSWADASGANVPEYERLAAHLSGLKMLSRDLNCAVLVISERNRQSMSGGGLSGGAGHRGIEYGAETVLDLDTDPNAPPPANGETAIRLHIRKNRHGGQVGQPIDLFFHGGLQRIRAA